MQNWFSSTLFGRVFGRGTYTSIVIAIKHWIVNTQITYRDPSPRELLGSTIFRHPVDLVIHLSIKSINTISPLLNVYRTGRRELIFFYYLSINRVTDRDRLIIVCRSHYYLLNKERFPFEYLFISFVIPFAHKLIISFEKNLSVIIDYRKYFVDCSLSIPPSGCFDMTPVHCQSRTNNNTVDVARIYTYKTSNRCVFYFIFFFLSKSSHVLLRPQLGRVIIRAVHGNAMQRTQSNVPLEKL